MITRFRRKLFVIGLSLSFFSFPSLVLAAGALDDSLQFSERDRRSLNNHEWAAQENGSNSHPYGHTILKHVNVPDSNLRARCKNSFGNFTTYKYDSEAREVVRALLRRNTNLINDIVVTNDYFANAPNAYFVGGRALNGYRKPIGGEFGRGIRCQGKNKGWPYSGMRRAHGYAEFLNTPGEKLMVVNGRTYKWYLVTSFPW